MTVPWETADYSHISDSVPAAGILPRPLADWAKHCKLPYASKCKSTEVNMNLYCYGFMAHLVAARQGKVIMTEEEYTARIFHFMNVMETAALHSQASDFQSHGWMVARDNDDKVIADIDRGFTDWASLGQSNHSGNFAMAVAANPRPALPGKLAAGRSRKDDEKTQVCNSYNKTTDEGCIFELRNPGKTCGYQHICSFCFKNEKKEFEHKEIVCRKKENASQPS